MIKRYFVDTCGRLAGEVLVAKPVNPGGLLIIDHPTILGDVTEWVWDGAALHHAPIPLQPTNVPAAISRFQARAALLQAGLLEDVESIMSNPEADTFASLAWKEASEFRRHSPTVLAISPSLGLTDAQLDDMFRFAASIHA